MVVHKTRIHYLDGIRGVAALLVVFGHFKDAFFDPVKNSTLSAVFWDSFGHFFLSASFCVQLFFVLSGFVLTYNAINKASFLSKQWTKRAFRLFVPVFLSALLYFIFVRGGFIHFKELSAVYSNEWIRQQWAFSYSFSQFLYGTFYSLMIVSDYSFINNINSALWTIPIELYWSYALFLGFLLLKFVRKNTSKNIILCIITLLVIRYAPFKGNIYGLLFLTGSLIALNYRYLIELFAGKRRLFLLIVTGLLTYCVDREWLPESGRLPFKWSYLVAGLYILCAVAVPGIHGFFSGKFIQWLGRISFPLYLLHMLAIGSVSSWLYVQVPSLRADWGLTVLLIIQLIFSLGIAHLFTVLVDEPLMKQFDKGYKKIIGERSGSKIKEMTAL
jgi:peptidoglycan/LPS O-acetylase OafA/YrhL